MSEKTYCAFCEAEATNIIERSSTPICSSCRAVYESGQANPHGTFKEIETAGMLPAETDETPAAAKKVKAPAALAKEVKEVLKRRQVVFCENGCNSTSSR